MFIKHSTMNIEHSASTANLASDFVTVFAKQKMNNPDHLAPPHRTGKIHPPSARIMETLHKRRRIFLFFFSSLRVRNCLKME